MPKNNGWVKLHRKLADNELWLAEPFTRGQAWIDLLLLANHKTGFIRRRGITVKVERGQVAWGEEALAHRWRWSRNKLRRFFSELTGRGMISRQHAEITTEQKTEQKNAPETAQKKTSVSALIYIENYDRYQANGTENGTEEKTENDTGTRRYKNIRKNPPAFSENEIPEMINRYPDPEIIEKTFQEISSTRKTGRIADSVKLGILKSWTKYPVESVMQGIRTYLEKNYASEGKNEKYLAGIIRNLPTPPATPTGPTMRRSGSYTLDRYYESEGYTLT